MVQEVSDVEIDAVRTDIRDFLRVRQDLTATDLANCTVLAQHTARAWISGGFRGGRQVVSEMKRVIALARAGDILAPGGGAMVSITEDMSAPSRRIKRRGEFYETQTVKRVAEVMDHCLTNCDIGVITADYGAGKTEAMRAWRRAHPAVESMVLEFDEYTRTNKIHFIRKLAANWGIRRDVGSMNGGLVFDELVEKIREQPALLIFDQCETVRPLICQIIRQIWDRTSDAGVGVVLMAAPILLRRLLQGNMPDLEALASRMGIVAPLTGLTRNEMAAIVKNEGFTEVDEAAFTLWYRAIGGSMRRLMKMITLLKTKHAGKRITERTISGVVGHLWGIALRVED